MKELRGLVERYGGRGVLLEHEVKGILRELGLQVPKGVFVGKEQGLAAPITQGLVAPITQGLVAPPLVAKVSSTKIISKTEAGGVITGIKDEGGLKTAVARLMGINGAEGVLIEEEVAGPFFEVIVGGLIDAQFGPVVMFGMGGLLVEVMRDVAFALAPLEKDEALRLIKRVKGSGLLINGFRGRPPSDMPALAHVITTVSEVMAAGLIEEIDLNPVAVSEKGAFVLDAKGGLLRTAS